MCCKRKHTRILRGFSDKDFGALFREQKKRRIFLSIILSWQEVKFLIKITVKNFFAHV